MAIRSRARRSEAQLERFRRHWDEHGFGLWALEEKSSGLLVGRSGLSLHRLWPAEPELGWMLDPCVRGQGYATEAGAAALHHAFGRLALERVVSIIHPENVSSFSVAERLRIAPWREVDLDDTGIALQVWSTSRAQWSAQPRS